MGRGVKFSRYFFLFNNLKKVNKDYMSHDDMTPLSRGYSGAIISNYDCKGTYENKERSL